MSQISKISSQRIQENQTATRVYNTDYKRIQTIQRKSVNPDRLVDLQKKRTTLNRALDRASKQHYLHPQVRIATNAPVTSTVNAPSFLLPSQSLSRKAPTKLDILAAAASFIEHNRLPIIIDRSTSIDIHFPLTPQVFPTVPIEFDFGLEATESIDSLIKTLKDLSLNVKIDDKIFEMLAKVHDKIPTLEKVNSSVTDILFKIVDSLKDLLPEFAILCVIVILLLKCRPTSNSGIFVFGVMLGAFASRFTTLSSSINSVIEHLFQDRLNPQIDSTSNFVEILAGIINTYLAVGSGSSIFDPRDLSRLITVLAKTDSAVSSIGKMVTILFTYIRSVIDKWYCGSGKSTFAITGIKFIDVFVVEANEIALLFENKELFAAQSSLDRVRAAIVQGDEIALKIPSSRDYIQIKFKINDCVNELKKIKKSLLATNFKFNGVRQEPTTILMRGAPGSGKSLCMQHLAHAVAALTFSPSDYKKYLDQPSAFVFNRQAENVYWDGYDQNMRIVFMDDILQARDVAGMPDNEIMNAIRAINVFENQLHCAAMESKGSTTFRSDFVMANTNMSNFNVESINDVGAFLRRWDVVVDVCPKSEFCVDSSVGIWARKLDPSKLPIVNGISRLHPDQLEFHVMKLQGRNFIPADVSLDFKGLVSLYHKTYLMKYQRHLAYLENLKDTLNEFRVSDSSLIPQMDVPHIQMEYLRSGPRSQEQVYLDVNSTIEQVELLQASDSLLLANIRLNKPLIYNYMRVIVWTSYGILRTDYGKSFTEDELMLILINVYRPILEDATMLRTPCPTSDAVSLVVRKAIEGTLASVLPAPLAKKISELKDSLYILRNSIVLPEWWQNRLADVYQFISKVISFETYTFAADWLHAHNIPPFCFMSSETRLISGIAIYSCAFTFAFQSALDVFLNLISWAFGIDLNPSRKLADKVVSLASNFGFPIVNPESDPRLGRSIHARNNMRNGRIARVKVNPILPVVSQALSSTNMGMRDVIYSVTGKNVFELWFPLPDWDREGKTHSRFGFVTAIRDRLILLPHHFMSTVLSRLNDEKCVKGDEIVEFRKVCSTRDNYYCTIDELISYWHPTPTMEELDLTILNLGVTFQPCRNIVSMFTTEKVLELYTRVSSVLYIPFDSFMPGGQRENKELIPCLATRQDTERSVDSPMFEAYTIARTFSYTAPTSGGDCGSLLFANDKHHGSLVIGMHVAGFELAEHGVSAVISKEFLERNLSCYPTVSVVEQLNLPLDLSAQVFENFTVIGTVPKDMTPSNSGRTKIVKSPLWGLWGESKTRPAPQRPFIVNDILIDPMANARSAYCKGDIYIPDTYLYAAFTSLQDMLNHTEVRKTPREILTFDVAVLGDTSGYFNPIPRNTSAGYPYSVMKGLRTKERFFGTAETYNLNNPECDLLRVQVSDIVENAKKNIRMTHVFTDCLKDERRKHEKCDTGNTRMFSACPTPLLVVARMYFGAFMRWITANSIHNGIDAASNPYSTDWDLIAQKLCQFTSVGNNIGAGDYKNFDMSERPRIHYYILRLINEWYDDPIGNQVREILWMEVVNSLHLNGDLLIQWSSSLSSGFLLTRVINDLYNHMNLRLCWLDKFGTIGEFNNFVYVITCGDDHVYSVDPFYSVMFSEKEVALSMAKLGMIYTPEDKSKKEFSNTLRSIHDVTFEKRKFSYDTKLKRFVAPLDIDVILEMPYWVKSGATTMADTEVNVSNALCELALHPRPIYEIWKVRMLKAINTIDGLKAPLDTNYFSLREMVLSRGLISTFTNDKILSSIDLHPQLRLLGSSNEYSERKVDAVLSCGRTRAIKRYCQGAVRAVLSKPRILNFTDALARVPYRKCAATTQITNGSSSDNLTFPVGQNNGASFTPQRTGDATDSFLSNGTTSATNDAFTPITTIDKFVPLNPGVLSSARTGTNQEIRDFLAKPYIVSSGNLATTDTFATTIYSAIIPSDLVAGRPVWANKMSGNAVFRATVVFTLQVNGNRFQQGRYILAWVPDGGAADPNRTLWVQGHSANLCQFTQLPHVELDINTDTQVTLEIPQINCSGWSPVNAQHGYVYQTGTVMLRPYSPLVAPTGSTTATYSLYVHFKDVEFEMPVYPQSNVRSRTTIKRRKPVQEEEQSSDGPVSSFLTKVGQAANLLTGVPLLSSIAQPVSWAADIGASVASVFGWSKPRQVEPFTLISRYIFPKFTNADTLDTSMKLSVMDSNCLEELPGFAGTDLDEMSLNYVSSIPAWYTTVVWHTGDGVSSALLSNQQCTPSFFYVNSTYGANTIVFPTPLTYSANFFAMYRGSIKFTFKLVKTEFHSGRLMFSFSPNDVNIISTPGDPGVFGSVYLHREMIDIRDGNEFSFVVPYTSITPYRSCNGPDTSYGTVSLEVLNPLVAPASVSGSIYILVEVSAAPDMEFAYPKNFAARPTYCVTPQSGGNNVKEISSAWVGNSAQAFPTEPSRMCIGERVLSFRQMIKRFVQIYPSVPGAVNNYFAFYPFSIAFDIVTAANLLTGSHVFPDTFSLLSHCYALSRGGVRYKILDNFPSDNKTFSAINVPIDGNTSHLSINFGYQAGSVSSVGGYGNGPPNSLTYTGITGGMELEVPYYNRTFAHGTADAIDFSNITSQYNVATAPRSIMQMSWNANPTSIVLFRAAADDFSLGLFVSVPGFNGWSTSTQ